MTTIVKTAIKNQLRNKRRTIFTELAIVFSVVIVLFVTAFMQSISASWKDNIIYADIGHIQMMSDGYKKKISSLPLNKTITNVNQMLDDLVHTEGVTSATKRISISGLVSFRSETAPFFGRGIDVKNVESVLPKIYSAIVDGKPLSEERKGSVILGKGLADLIGAKVGDRLLLAAYDKHNALNATEVYVQGIFNIPEENVNSRFLISDFETMQSLSRLDNSATEVLLRVSNTLPIDGHIATLKKHFPKFDFVPWHDLAGSYVQATRMFSMSSMVVGLILYILVLMMLANTILTSVFERKREIGTLMALGSSKRSVVASFILESLCLAYIGIIIGTLTYRLILIMLKNSLEIPPLPGGTENIILHLLFDWKQVVSITITMSIIASLAALYPALIASKVDPIESIRNRT